MNPFRTVVLTIALALLVGTVTSSPAQAAPQSIFGANVEVTAVLPSNDSLLGGTAYVPQSGGSFFVTLDSQLGSDVEVTLLDGSTTLSSCTIVSSTNGCTLPSTGALTAGSIPVTVRFTMGATSVDYVGTLFAVTDASSSMRIEWQDAAGTWVNGSGANLPLMGPIAMRCVIVNNSNAPITFSSFTGSYDTSSTSGSAAPFAGTLAAGESRAYPAWSGTALDGPKGLCTGIVGMSDGNGFYTGASGDVTPIGGTITTDRTPAPGATVTLTGALISPPVITSFRVLLDGVEVTGSPVTIASPDYGFSIDVAVPSSLAAGAHSLVVMADYDGRDIAFAVFPFSVADPELAATGAAMNAPLGLGALALLSGLALLLAARRRRVA